MIFREIDWREPFSAFAPLAGEAHAHLLHAGNIAPGQWSTIVAFPENRIELTEGNADRWLVELDAAIAARASAVAAPTPAPFHSGLVGFVGYEALSALEPGLDLPASPYDLPAASFGVYNAAAVFSRDERRAYVAGRSEAAILRLQEALGDGPHFPPPPPCFSGLQSNFTQSAYEGAVSAVIERIRNGEFYQANIAQTMMLTSAQPCLPLALFEAVASNSDAAFGALLQFESGAVISNSPERFFKIAPATGGRRRVTTEPIKGTRRRGEDAVSDARLAQELIGDPKDRAENIMIADLMRNDLSKVCEDGSICEEAICELMTLSKVHHLVSRISGVLRREATIADVFRALFPAGSISGAPKVAAMEAIGEIEKTGRGPYCGAIGYIDDRGGADFAVAIRTMMIDGGGRNASVPVGGGITLRSNPAAEYEETLVKARGVLDVLSQGGGP